MIRNPRVVITGMGVLAPSGIGLDAFWDSLIHCRSGINEISHFDSSSFDVRVAGEIQDFNLSQYIGNIVKAKRISRHTQFSLAAFKMALDHAGLSLEEFRTYGVVPVVIGVSTSAIEVVTENQMKYVEKGPMSVNPFGVTNSQPHAIATTIAEVFGFQSTAHTLASACPAGIDAVIYGANLIRSGKADIVIAGGADAPITPVTMASLSKAGLAPGFDFPAHQCSRPFDSKRRGGVISEGAAVFVMESLNHAMMRGAYPWAEVLGSGTSMDTNHSAGEGLKDSMEEAMANAGVHHDDLEYISAHGPSHPIIDRAETQAIKKLFKKSSYSIPVSSIKGVIGNPLAAAGPLQIAACALGMKKDVVPPTANYEFPDSECDLDYVPLKPYNMSYASCMVNVHGLGGGNSSILIGKVNGA